MSRPSEMALQAAAQAWCTPDTEDRVMDPPLAEAFARILDNWIESARQFACNADFYRGLLDDTAKHLGPEVFVSDDGSVQDEPLRLKIPEMVRELAAIPHLAGDSR